MLNVYVQNWFGLRDVGTGLCDRPQRVNATEGGLVISSQPVNTMCGQLLNTFHIFKLRTIDGVDVFSSCLTFQRILLSHFITK